MLVVQARIHDALQGIADAVVRRTLQVDDLVGFVADIDIDVLQLHEGDVVFIQVLQQGLAADVAVDPGNEAGVTVLAHDIGMDVGIRKAKELRQGVAQPGGIQHRAGADDLVRGKTQRLVGHIRHDVRRVVGHDQDAAEVVLLQLLADAFRDPGVDLYQLQTGLTRFLRCAGCQYADVRIRCILIAASLDLHLGRRIDQTVVQVHGFAPCLVGVYIHQHQFVNAPFVEHRIGETHAHHAGADEHDFTLGNFFHITVFLLLSSIIKRVMKNRNEKHVRRRAKYWNYP